MALNKQPVNINFSQGLDTKTDPWQIPIGKFSELTNSVFTKEGLLTKRNGFAELPTPSAEVPDYLTTANGNLLAITNSVQAYSEPTLSWVNTGPRYNVGLSTLSLVKTAFSQIYSDSAVSPNGLTCVVSSSQDIAAGPTILTHTSFYVLDSKTGQVIIPEAGLDTPPVAVTTKGFPRVYVLGDYFIIIFSSASTPGTIMYTAVNYLTLSVVTNVLITGENTTYFYKDAVVINNVLYVVYNTTNPVINVIPLSSSLVVGGAQTVDSSHIGENFSATVDLTNSNLWLSYVDEATQFVYAVAVSTPALTPLFTPVSVFTFAVPPVGPGTHPAAHVTSLATAGVATIYVGVPDAYSYDLNQLEYYIEQNTVTNAGVVGTENRIANVLDIASRAFYINGVPYMLGLFASRQDQPTLFLFNTLGNQFNLGIVAKLAYGNSGVSAYGQYLIGTPNVTVIGTTAYVSYLIQDYDEPQQGQFLSPSNGINQVTFSFSDVTIASIETGSILNISGGFLWGYDGNVATENGFFLAPDPVEAQINGAGTLPAQEYFYQAIYVYVDNKGNRVQSAPSLVQSVTVNGSQMVTVYVPNSRLSYKTATTSIEIYRASTAQPTFFKLTNDFIPNEPSVDNFAFNDNTLDSDILGNEILYTAGGVLEDINGPASSIMTVWDDRVWLVDAEDPNLLWFSKQVIEATPIEMSSDLTFYVATSSSSQGFPGPVTGLHQLDDKLIVFHENLIEYINGSGPDNTGANANLSQPIVVTSTSGCLSSSSIGVVPQGLLYQADKGIWLLGRDLSTTYIGAPVERYTQYDTVNKIQPLVVAIVGIPDTTQIRINMSTGVILMYDYFYKQWGTFSGVEGTSSIIYQGLYTMVDMAGLVVQETPGLYADYLTTPVNMSFQTGWINIAGLQGFERAYYFYMLGQYFSSHTVQIQVGYDYLTTIEQTLLITPSQVAPIPVSTSNVEQWRVFLQRQKCQSFQITISEQDTTPGEGLTISGLNLVIGTKKGYPTRRENLSVG